MIYIYGDSHANRSFKNIKLPVTDRHCNSITMFRIGRDNLIINFNKNEKMIETDIIMLSYGEIDCRCHIQRQVNAGRNEDDVIHELVHKYFQTIQNNVVQTCKIIIIGIIPTTKQCEHEALYGPITHEFPFVGTDEYRVRYTNKVNNKLEEYAHANNYVYFNPYAYYARPDGTLKFELSDTYGHLRDNSYFLEKFYECLNI